MFCEGVKLAISLGGEEHRLRVLENRVLRKVFGPKREEMTGERRRIHNEQLYLLHSSLNITRVMKSRRMI
jgi:hypothetical protein